MMTFHWSFPSPKSGTGKIGWNATSPPIDSSP
jgi:hypothetical protein